MSKINPPVKVPAVSISDTFSTTEATIVATAPVELPVASPPVATPAFRQRVPAYWDIKDGSKPGTILAVSNMGDRFEGTGKEFNKLMRG